MSKRQSIHALELGGTLFIPASHKNLDAVLSGEKYPDLRSVVIDFEDGLSSADRPEALANLDLTLTKLEETKLLRFIRPQDPQMLKALLEQKGMDKLDGFILPKFGLNNADDYLSHFPVPIPHSPFPWHFMPSIEGEELFDMQKLRQLRGILLLHQEQIICIRFGAEDMFRQLGLRRTTTSLYDMLAPAQVIAN
ncbi:MAG: HpcH/HpaI aldolase/citrate lyase family protein, partial [Sulfurimonadaceae bacterium]